MAPAKTTRQKERNIALRAYSEGDYAVAFKTLGRFAAEGDAEAQVAIATIHQLGLGGVPTNEDEAIKWYTRAAKQGNAVAANNLGTIAMLRKDYSAAKKWYTRAREQGFVHSPKT